MQSMNKQEYRSVFLVSQSAFTSESGESVVTQSKSIQDLDDFPSERFIFNQWVGKEGLRLVICGCDCTLKRRVIIKRIPKNQIDWALQEWQKGLLSHRNPYIPTVYRIYKNRDFIYLVQDSIEVKDLKASMGIKKEGIPEDVAIYIFKEIVSSVNHLHNEGIIHRDIKPENILLENRRGDKGAVWLIDSGTSCLCESPTRLLAGTPAFMAPEILTELHSKKTDIWSLGVLFFYMLTGVLPFGKEVYNFFELASKQRNDCALSEKMKTLLISRASLPARDLIYKMLRVDPEERLDGGAVLQHPCMNVNSRSWTSQEISTEKLMAGPLLE